MHHPTATLEFMICATLKFMICATSMSLGDYNGATTISQSARSKAAASLTLGLVLFGGAGSDSAVAGVLADMWCRLRWEKCTPAALPCTLSALYRLNNALPAAVPLASDSVTHRDACCQSTTCQRLAQQTVHKFAMPMNTFVYDYTILLCWTAQHVEQDAHQVTLLWVLFCSAVLPDSPAKQLPRGCTSDV